MPPRKKTGLPFWVRQSFGAVVEEQWVPTDDEDLEFWFDSSFGITKDGSDLISQWDDRSGNGRHATAAGGDRPTWVANQLNGFPAVTMNATDYMDFGTDNIVAPGSPFFFAFVAQAVAGVDPWYRTLITVRTATAVRNFSVVVSTDANFGQLWWTIAGAGTPRGVGVATTDFTSAATDGMIGYNGGDEILAASWEAYRNGSILTDAQTTGGTSHNDNGNRIGSWGNATPPNFGWSGSIYDMLLISRAPDATLLSNVQSYFLSKWGI